MRQLIIASAMLFALGSAIGQDLPTPTPRKAQIGILLADKVETKEGNPEKGVLVMEVMPGSPAAKFGIKPGDRILSLNGTVIDRNEQFVDEVAKRNPGDKVSLEVVRQGNKSTMEIELTKPVNEFPRNPGVIPNMPGARGFFDDDGQALRPKTYLGVKVQPIDNNLKEKLKLNVDTGVLVTEVEPRSPASMVGLRSEDVIVEANGKPVVSVEEFQKLVGNMKSGEPLSLKVMRGEQTINMTVQVSGRIMRFGAAGDGMPQEFQEMLQRQQEMLQRQQEMLRQQPFPRFPQFRQDDQFNPMNDPRILKMEKDLGDLREQVKQLRQELERMRGEKSNTQSNKKDVPIPPTVPDNKPTPPPAPTNKPNP